MFRNQDTHIHFVGIGGIGMSGIAEVLLDLGYRVTGTDLAESDTTRRLQGLGALVHRGHDAGHLGDADVVVISSAVRADNPEVLAARVRKIPVIPRAEMLAELMRLKQGICIGGSHGKTTTTSLIASALHEAGLDPTIVIGGKLDALGSNAKLGRGDLLVAEADESDGSFLMLTPTFAVVTNVDGEHIDHHGSMANLLEAFVGFVNRVPFYGMAIVCVDDPNVRAMLPRLHKRVVTYGFSQGADYVASEVVHGDETTRFRVSARGVDQGVFGVRMPGLHNVLNALATIALCDEQEIPADVTRKALAEFAGVQRRFSARGERRGVKVFDDYGHHPTEIRATLAGARARYPHARLVAIVQPHRYTRLRDTFLDFPASLDDADVVVVTEVYAAGEAPIPGIDGQTLIQRLRERVPERSAVFVPAIGDVAAKVATSLREGDVVITLGAGNVTKVSHELVAILEADA